jgi:hypothetical protein
VSARVSARRKRPAGNIFRICLLSKEHSACSVTRMRPYPALLIAIMCLSLLTMQMSGLHLHVSLDTQSGALHGAHLHDAASGEHGHDHDAEIDVSSFESGITWSKLIPILVALIFALLPIIRTSTTVRPPLIERFPTRHRSRWQPPLRAPPQHVL